MPLLKEIRPLIDPQLYDSLNAWYVSTRGKMPKNFSAVLAALWNENQSLTKVQKQFIEDLDQK